MISPILKGKGENSKTKWCCLELYKPGLMLMIVVAEHEQALSERLVSSGPETYILN